MPSALDSGAAPARHDDLDNYNVDDFSDNPFATPSPPSSAKKRKERNDDLGINEEVSVQKRARVPNVKLDEDRLLSDAGIPRLRKRARDLKLKGKGHEFSDGARLLSFYQLWLDDLFPKAKFLDALAMVEKAGHKRKLMTARNEWISEGRPKDSTTADDEDDDFLAPAAAGEGSDNAAARPTTPPPRDDVPDDDDDIYGATPRVSRPAPTSLPNDAPDEDDLDALMAETESHDRPAAPTRAPPAEEDDLDAMMAEAEAEDQTRTQDKAPGAGTSKQGQDSFEDEEAAMQEMDGMW